MNRNFVLLLLATLSLASCGKPDADAGASAPATPNSAATPAGDAAAAGSPASADPATASLNAGEPPMPALGDFRVVSVLMGNAVDAERVVLGDAREFKPKDAIHASVLSIGAHQGLKLSADWIAPDGKSFAKSEQAIVPASDLATTFKVQHPQGWPLGDYQLRIAINGHTLRTEKFSVR